MSRQKTSFDLFAGQRRLLRCSSRRGSLVPLVAVAFVILIVATAFSVDTAYIQLTRTEMRSAVDAAARGAGQVLASGGSDSSARQAAKEVALQNRVAGTPLRLADADIVVGKSTRDSNGVYNFVAGASPSNAFQIGGRRDADSIDGQIKSIFGGLLGVSRFNSTQSATVVRGDRDVMLVLDISGSMMFRLDQDRVFPAGHDESTPPHPNQSRWGVLCESMDVLFSTLEATTPIEKVGLVTFDTAAKFEQTLNSTYSPITRRINAISGSPLSGWTNLGEGMQIARDKLLSSPDSSLHAARTIILLTDGQPNLGPDPMAEAQACRLANITVHTISYSAFADTAMMQAIADTTGGDYYSAPNAGTLQKAFQKIGRDLPVLLTQ